MRFIPNGPDIPLSLLKARDENRVIFFCGAGVSQACSGICSFEELTQKVFEKLHVSKTDGIYTLIERIKTVEEEHGVHGLLSTDRIYRELEREFDPAEIKSAFVDALSDDSSSNLSAHETLLKLATTDDNRVQIVTTNFDRFFSRCDPDVPVYHPPNIAGHVNPKTFHGILHLHGCLDVDHNSIESRDLILTSVDFGAAYLADGWATQFYKQLFKDYVIVFVGYSAEDAPVMYLLEALGAQQGNFLEAYAFHDSSQDDHWNAKGITSISYSTDEEHRNLWETLKRWAVKVSEPERWASETLKLACCSPRMLEPIQREQVALFVSDLDGAKKFLDCDPSPCPEWLCVFSSKYRLRKTASWDEREAASSPYSSYGLASDPIPQNKKSNSQIRNGEWGWDAFEQSFDTHQRQALNTFFQGHNNLSSRVWALARWMAKNIDHPITVWWASQQRSVHPAVQDIISDSLYRSASDVPTNLAEAWFDILEAWQNSSRILNRELHMVEGVISKHGLSTALLRAWKKLTRPFICTKTSLYPDLPPGFDDLPLLRRDFLRFEIKYEDEYRTPAVCAEWLPAIVGASKENLQEAVKLEERFGDYFNLRRLPLVVSSERDQQGNFFQGNCLNAQLLWFISLFEKFIDSHLDLARKEANSWRTINNPLFDRLCIWAAAKGNFLSSSDSVALICGLSRDAFWEYQHEADLLSALRERWSGYSSSMIRRIENKLLLGPKLPSRIAKNEQLNYKSTTILTRLNYLKKHGCKFTFNFDEKKEVLVSNMTNKEEEVLPSSHVSRSGFIKVVTNKDASVFVSKSKEEILRKAEEALDKYPVYGERENPFAGLVENDPEKALVVLCYGLELGELHPRLWKTFLEQTRNEPQLILLINTAKHLMAVPKELLSEIYYDIGLWFEYVAKLFFNGSSKFFFEFCDWAVELLDDLSAENASAVVRGSLEIDWATEALNSLAGKIARAVVVTFDSKKPDQFGNALLCFEKLLNAPEDHKRLALVMISHQLRYLYQEEADWTERHLLPILSSGDLDTIDAFWSGYLWEGGIPTTDLFVKIKTSLLAFIGRDKELRRKYNAAIAYILLHKWECTSSQISSDDLRNVLLKNDDGLRTSILSQISAWVTSEDDNTRISWELASVRFFEEVWPKQLRIRTANTTGALCRILFSSAETVRRFSPYILPLLGKTNEQYDRWTYFLSDKDEIFDQYPDVILKVLVRTLPDTTEVWPYGLYDVLQKLKDTEVGGDREFQEIKRKWDNR
ncbi:SIR2 family protein [Halodesulfovibrio sp.]|jgi:hypothetical protein|uniref:SIR2 family protein n=1 Tax=Halodesulfovibrio sp. TaxID=1912772 RepID=UPI0025F326C5|nr:SIR2 family protein [Halodesulfovibrio sp.]MCT4627724.1 SIR2 family protein [Halodesulfovibrio sp.]